MIKNNAALICLAALLFSSALSSGQYCRKFTSDPAGYLDTPTSRFAINGNTVSDLNTGLVWQRCHLGASWNGSNCISDGSNLTYTWEAALSEADSNSLNGHNDWHLPNIKELMSISEGVCEDPSINLEVFPDTPAAKFWTSTPRDYLPSYSKVRAANFASGYTSSAKMDEYLYVRLVR